MTGIGFTELLMIGAVLLLFIGPKQMVVVVRFVVRWWFIIKKQFEKIRDELFDMPEIQKMIAEIKHDVYGEKPEDSSPENSSERHDN